MKRQGKDFSGRDTPLFPTMLVQAKKVMGEEPIIDEVTNVESVPTHSNDLLLSGEDSLKLNELMELCTILQSRVLALETKKTNQALEIDSLKRRVQKLEKRKGQELIDSKGCTRKIADLDADVEVTLIDETQGRNDEEMFDTGMLEGDEVFVAEQSEKVVEEVVNTATTTVDEELTLAQTLIEIKSAKPKT
ncbi:hypothetical protein Tco_0760640 [Tanacetum coccineum]